MDIKIHRIITGTRAEGPGKRICIWFQGCSRHCEGCYAVDTWSHQAGSALPVADIAAMMDEAAGIEGITVIGGEPFEQTEGLTELLREARSRGLSTVVFTGYTYEELQARTFDTETALSCIDVLIDGRYVEELRSFDVPLVGSSNQRYHFLTDRYTMKDFGKEGHRNTVEVRISKDGSVSFNGMGDFRELRRIYERR